MQSISLPVLHGKPSPEVDVPRLVPHLLPGDKVRGAVVVLPGGGYFVRAPHEADPVAKAYNACGYHAFVLHYRVSPCRHPAPLADAVQAMRTIRSHAAEWKVSPQHIAVCGFSAGAHLAGSLGVLYNRIPDQPGAPGARPDAMILSYAVLSTAAKHAGSYDNLIGPEATDAERDEFSIERFVDASTPPTFLWHTADDDGVPVENSLIMATALRQHKVPFELHVFPHGPHGVGLADDPARNLSPRLASWLKLSGDWLAEMGWPH